MSLTADDELKPFSNNRITLYSSLDTLTASVDEVSARALLELDKYHIVKCRVQVLDVVEDHQQLIADRLGDLMVAERV